MASREWHPQFRGLAHSRKLAELPDDECRLLYTLLGLACDSWGRAEADPMRLDHEAWGGLRKGPETTSRCLHELARVGLVTLYDGPDGRGYLVLVDHERFAGSLQHSERRGFSRCPDPPGFKTPTAWRRWRRKASPWIGAETDGDDDPRPGHPVRTESGLNPSDPVRTKSGVSPDQEGQSGLSPPRQDLATRATHSSLQLSGARGSEPPPRTPVRTKSGLDVVPGERACPHCRQPAILRLDPRRPTTFCEKHPSIPIAGTSNRICNTRKHAACRSWEGAAEPFAIRCVECSAPQAPAAPPSAAPAGHHGNGNGKGHDELGVLPIGDLDLLKRKFGPKAPTSAGPTSACMVCGSPMAWELDQRVAPSYCPDHPATVTGGARRHVCSTGSTKLCARPLTQSFAFSAPCADCASGKRRSAAPATQPRFAPEAGEP